MKRAIKLTILAATLLYIGLLPPVLGFGQPPGKYVVLTFDDGPDPRYTPEILSVLGEHQIRALFYVVGKSADRYPDLLKSIADCGHTIGNHTFSHQSIMSLTDSEILAEIRLTDEKIAWRTGQAACWFRPPRGRYTRGNLALLREAGKEVLLWDVGLEKERIGTAAEMVGTLLRRVRGRDSLVLLLHDGDPDSRHDRSTTVEALPLLIEKLRERGYMFVDPSSQQGRNILLSYARRNQKFK